MRTHLPTSLITALDGWNWFLSIHPPRHRKESIFHLQGKHLISPLTFSTKTQSNQIIYLPGILLPSVKYGLFLAVGAMEFALTGPGENSQFTAKFEVQPIFMRNEGWLWKETNPGPALTRWRFQQWESAKCIRGIKWAESGNAQSPEIRVGSSQETELLPGESWNPDHIRRGHSWAIKDSRTSELLFATEEMGVHSWSWELTTCKKKLQSEYKFNHQSMNLFYLKHRCPY